ncbi:E3 SUMO-protein ligase ZBED1-like isoform X1 [Stomoxys calcitrans]|uniref:E3 SUMO-protein ligase ZBED1-like isoform X1 n=1 Tax=Stomoxys calcitrans TaxID=35570 RepID=UPI0027E358AD|nr:E3 SUMO-protein ligase ZBED1-like isoform X1 [Stomoxys calcitrans]XP_059216913.1 E3 SUMO-protein ligase ZBED1-like isoform X1 [Stomoxys calcitrans]XP_059219280.1 E3 SUMO-protein ligase ZBED1-like isoform X1 [Stomoxys calcitrans]XP_059219289.1 E3 SUMO-protein ligase ZBED1-like isoform X1 [Stomoxys calcitrans]XP_059223446.1 E3 SUMO-protein ligase ZBED1-like isoform X1 [Stomoxys calcitrans]XP_059223447.1 E3 SUMO-protein ligase ZBED1-like isoform X1 [Stomoxys calcitrans]XP_059225388.1 E3 SUMO-
MAEKRKSSAIWAHFEEIATEKAKCKYCKNILSIASGSIGNLSRHMKRKHPLIPIKVERQTQSIIHDLESNIIDQQQSTNIAKTASSVDIVDITNNSGSIASNARTQSNITQFLQKPPPARKVEKIDLQLLKMIVKGHHAFRLVEEPEFKILLELVSRCPNYTLPSRKKVSNVLLLSTYNDVLDDVKIQIQSASAVCLTTDGWTSRSHCSYLAVTAHYINNNTEMRAHLLSCVEFNERHTAENLAACIKELCIEFGILNKVSAVVTDNASNIVAAIRAGNWRWVGCFAHSLNLVVQNSLHPIDSILKKVRKIVTFFHKSSNALKKLYENQRQGTQTPLKLKHDVETRWNSTYEMLQRIFNLKDAVITTLSLIRPDLLFPLEEWDLIEEILPILKPFYQMTMDISAEKSVTLSKVLVLCNILEQTISKITSTNSIISNMLTILRNDLNTRFGSYERNYLYAESALLDPRFKRRAFKSEGSYDFAVQQLRERIIRIRLPDVDINNNSESAKLSPQNDDLDEPDYWKFFDEQYKNNTKTENNTAAAIKELDKYLKEDYIGRKLDPLKWWNLMKNVYPRLYIHVLKRLCITATSVPCERIFSATGQIISERRTHLKPSKVEKVVFLHNNM